MGNGRTIRIYLNDGTIAGISHAEIVNWTGQAILSPRTKVKALTEWPEVNRPGVYFLFGIDDDTGNANVYIGESENVYGRLQNHIANKEFWSEVVFFTSKDENLTKTHIKYLEARLVQMAKAANRYVILNGTQPKLPTLPRGDRDSMESFLSNMRILLGVIGHKTLEELVSRKMIDRSRDAMPASDMSPDESVVWLKYKDVAATGVLSSEGFVVLSGSTIATTTNSSLRDGPIKLRSRLLEDGTIRKSGDFLEFSKDHLFSSPSMAASIVTGSSINGRTAWKTALGKSLKDLEEGV